LELNCGGTGRRKKRSFKDRINAAKAKKVYI